MTGSGDPWLAKLQAEADVLMFTFDFEPLSHPAEPLGLTVAGARSMGAFASDATGGHYVECEMARGRYIFHADRWGYAHVLGGSIPETVALLVAMPYWRELLAASGGDRGAMRAAAERLEREVCQDIEVLPAARQYLRRELTLPAIDDPPEQLWNWVAVRGAELDVLDADGYPLAREVRAAARQTA